VQKLPMLLSTSGKITTSIEPKPFNHHYVSHYRPSFATIVTIIVHFFVVTPFISKLKSPPHGDVV
jgi:hypothetical protein